VIIVNFKDNGPTITRYSFLKRDKNAQVSMQKLLDATYNEAKGENRPIKNMVLLNNHSKRKIETYWIGKTKFKLSDCNKDVSAFTCVIYFFGREKMRFYSYPGYDNENKAMSQAKLVAYAHATAIKDNKKVESVLLYHNPLSSNNYAKKLIKNYKLDPANNLVLR